MTRPFARCTFLFFLLIGILLKGYAQETPPVKLINGKKYYIHRVKKGQSLYGIAKIYGLDLNVMIMENPEAIDGIKTGQDLKVPVEKPKPSNSPPTTDDASYITHQVKKGETLYSISKEFQIKETALLNLNPGLSEGLKEGSVLKIRAKTEEKDLQKEKEKEQKKEISGGGINDSLIQSFSQKPKKPKYNVGIFLPFGLHEGDSLNIDDLILGKGSFPATQQLAIDFMTGIRLAADSLKDNNFEIVFSLFDLGEKDSSTTRKIENETGFRDLDLIIGPLFNQAFHTVSTAAKKFQIPCVSPLTQQNKVLFENVLTSKVTPSMSALLSQLAIYCADSLSKQNLVLVNSGQQRDLFIQKSFRQAYQDRIDQLDRKDSLPLTIPPEALKSNYKSDRNNYYILLTENEVAISSFLTRLTMFSEKKENVKIIGLRKWLLFDNLDLEYLSRFEFLFATPYFIDHENPSIMEFNRIYKGKFYCDAGDFFFLGLEMGKYYLQLLKEKGSSGFLKLDEEKYRGQIMDFDFFHPNFNTGFENKAASVIKYSDYKLKKVN